MALCDLAGKAYGIPAYMLAGGKYRDKVKVYADTPLKKDPKEMGEALKGRMERGFEFLKMDIGLWIASEFENGVINKKEIKVFGKRNKERININFKKAIQKTWRKNNFYFRNIF